MGNEETDQPYNLVEKFFLKLLEPQNKARILRWAWLISLGMLVLGYLIVFYKASPYINF
ncbi:hypothetical protein J2755_001984 [Methanohalophilus levihalophilus]|uniref:hypothetical protein n=1 Tax=Methanohalophilus levihalophilus TaxID=1431282 RepID=UPI001AE63750|nr:hypothetical protein [Methanohalophilus levihalophilus]MBP2031036.1 hypothetical protein [Methanohalophilus levihalophilus]